MGRLEDMGCNLHTDECLAYAAKNGHSFCIASCSDRRAALVERVARVLCELDLVRWDDAYSDEILDYKTRARQVLNAISEEK